MAIKEKHICKFKKITYKSGNQVYFCTLPDCNKKINPALALGKRAICWRCGNDFILTDYSLRLVKPHCENCHKPKVSGHVEDVGFNADNHISIDENIPLILHEVTHFPTAPAELSLAERMQKITQLKNDDEDI